MKWFLWSLAIGGGLVALGFLMLGRGRGISGGRLGRIARLSRLSARLSASWFGARARRLFARGDRRKQLDTASRKAAAETVAREMGQMKGAIMKLGQMMSFVSDDIPEEYRGALASLQHAAPAMDFPLLRDVAERELKMPLERAFARFDTKALAAASIGQVHRASLRDGTEVVVKIQYPGVADAIRADLANAGMLYQMMAMFYPALDPKPVVDELRERLTEELDYAKEASSQTKFAELYANHPFIRIPRVIPSHSTSLVLTSEFIAGRHFADVLADEPDAKNRWAEILYRFVFGSIIRHGVFNGDPHPGNYLFDDEGRIAFLDFGCTKWFPADMLAHWQALVRAHLGGNRDAFRAVAVTLGFLKENAPVPADKLFDYYGLKTAKRLAATLATLDKLAVDRSKKVSAIAIEARDHIVERGEYEGVRAKFPWILNYDEKFLKRALTLLGENRPIVHRYIYGWIARGTWNNKALPKFAVAKLRQLAKTSPDARALLDEL